MLAQSPEAGYIHEPFHPNARPGMSSARFDQWYTYVDDQNAGLYHDAIARTLAFSYDYGAELRSISSIRDVGRMGRDASVTLVNRVGRRRPVMKDPNAVFSSEWLARTFSMDVVFTIRHPAAVANSLLRLDWTTDFAQFTEQPRLVAAYLEPFVDELGAAVAKPPEPIDQAALLWKLIYHTAVGFSADHPDWRFVKHEDLAGDPVGGFAEIYDRLGLTMTDRVRRAIEQHSASSNPAEAPGATAHLLRRDSTAAADVWRARLTPQQVDRIRTDVEPLASRFYSDEDW